MPKIIEGSEVNNEEKEDSLSIVIPDFDKEYWELYKAITTRNPDLVGKCLDKLKTKEVFSKNAYILLSISKGCVKNDEKKLENETQLLEESKASHEKSLKIQSILTDNLPIQKLSNKEENWNLENESSEEDDSESESSEEEELLFMRTPTLSDDDVEEMQGLVSFQRALPRPNPRCLVRSLTV